VSLSVSADGKFVATGSTEGELAVFRTSDMKWIMRKNVHQYFVTKIVFSPKSTHIFSTSGDYSVAATTLQNTRGIISMYQKELFVTLAIMVALLAVFFQTSLI